MDTIMWTPQLAHYFARLREAASTFLGARATNAESRVLNTQTTTSPGQQKLGTAQAILCTINQSAMWAQGECRLPSPVRSWNAVKRTVDCGHRWTERLARLRRRREEAEESMRARLGEDWRVVAERNLDISRARYEEEMLERAVQESWRTCEQESWRAARAGGSQ